MDKIKTSEMFSYIINFVDYITLFNLKYTNKRIRAFIKELHLDNVMDLRNTKYHKENNVIYKLLTKHAPFLNKVILEFREINDTHVYKFTNRLTHINLNYCQKLTDRSLKHIASTCKQLLHLELYIIPTITDNGLIDIITNCKLIEYLNLSGCKQLTNESLQYIPKCLCNLWFLDLTRCLGTTDEILVSLVTLCKKLRHLNLYALPDLKCDFIYHLPEDGVIEFLDLCGNQCVEDEQFVHAKNKFKNIKALNFSWSSKLTDKTIEALFKDNNEDCKLELISLHGLLGITDYAVDVMGMNKGIKENLKIIDLCSCSNVVNRQKEFLKEKFPKLERFQYF